MKLPLRISSLFVISIFLVSCMTGHPIYKQEPSNNDTYQVEYLFEHDGCKVYRFYDHGYVYFTNCTGEVTSVKSDSTKSKVLNIIRNVEPDHKDEK